MSRITLVTGGIRSGKSAYAVSRALKAGERRCFLASAEPLDHEMKIRIARHQEEREGKFTTEEEPLRPARILAEAAGRYDVVLMDCLTLWVNNLAYHFKKDLQKIEVEINAFLTELEKRETSIIIVTNEIGSGVVPPDPESRRFVDDLGRLNQRVAALADEVICMVSGIPSAVKGNIYV